MDTGDLRYVEDVKIDLQCGICHNMFVDLCIVACGHTFCKACSQTAAQLDSQCPECQQRVGLGSTTLAAASAINHSHVKYPKGCFIIVEEQNLEKLRPQNATQRLVTKPKVETYRLHFRELGEIDMDGNPT